MQRLKEPLQTTAEYNISALCLCESLFVITACLLLEEGGSPDNLYVLLCSLIRIKRSFETFLF